MIHYLIGDATEPHGHGHKIVAHVCNDIGAWGRGFVLSLSRKWPEPEAVYRRWYQEQDETNINDMSINVRLELGQTVNVIVDKTADNQIFVANMVAQMGIMAKDGIEPIRYDALHKCLNDVAANARKFPATVHMPRIGCGLAGGEWKKVEAIINEVMSDIDVYVYDFETQDARTIPWKK